MNLPLGIKVGVSGIALRIRPEDETLVKDLRDRGVPETEICRILSERQMADQEPEN